MTALLAGYPLWVQFFGPLQQRGSPFTTDFFKNDLAGFVVPSSLMVFHTAGSAAEAAQYQGHLPEYLGYLGWPLLVLLVLAAVRFWRGSSCASGLWYGGKAATKPACCHKTVDQR